MKLQYAKIPPILWLVGKDSGGFENSKEFSKPCSTGFEKHSFSKPCSTGIRWVRNHHDKHVIITCYLPMMGGFWQSQKIFTVQVKNFSNESSKTDKNK